MHSNNRQVGFDTAKESMAASLWFVSGRRHFTYECLMGVHVFTATLDDDLRAALAAFVTDICDRIDLLLFSSDAPPS